LFWLINTCPASVNGLQNNVNALSPSWNVTVVSSVLASTNLIAGSWPSIFSLVAANTCGSLSPNLKHHSQGKIGVNSFCSIVILVLGFPCLFVFVINF